MRSPAEFGANYQVCRELVHRLALLEVPDGTVTPEQQAEIIGWFRELGAGYSEFQHLAEKPGFYGYEIQLDDGSKRTWHFKLQLVRNNGQANNFFDVLREVEAGDVGWLAYRFKTGSYQKDYESEHRVLVGNTGVILKRFYQKEMDRVLVDPHIGKVWVFRGPYMLANWLRKSGVVQGDPEQLMRDVLRSEPLKDDRTKPLSRKEDDALMLAEFRSQR